MSSFWYSLFNAILLFAFHCDDLKLVSETAGAIPFPNMCSNSISGHARWLKALLILVLKMPKAEMVQPLWASCVTAWLCLLWKYLLASLNSSLFNLWRWSIILPLFTTENSLAFIFCVLKSKTYYYLMWPLCITELYVSSCCSWGTSLSSKFKVPLAGFLMRLLTAAQYPPVPLVSGFSCDFVCGQFEPAISSPPIWPISPSLCLPSPHSPWLSKFLCLCVSLIFHMTCSPPLNSASQGRCLHPHDSAFFSCLCLPQPQVPA